MTDLEKAGSGSVESEDFNAVVDRLRQGPPAHTVTAADVDSQAAQNGDVLTADGAGGASWETGGSGPTFYTGTDPPVSGTGSVFEVSRLGDPNTTGTFALTFRGDTTTPLAFDAMSEDIVTALQVLDSTQFAVGIEEGYEGLSVNDFAIRFVFTGGLLGPTEDPTVTDDTTDFGIVVYDISTGDSGDPPAPVEFDVFVQDGLPAHLYVFDSADWQPVSPVHVGITTDMLQDGAVTGAKIAGGGVTHTQIGTSEVYEFNIADGAVTSLKLGTPVAHLASGSTLDELLSALIAGKVMAAS